jgi:ligand-binding sensor protein
METEIKELDTMKAYKYNGVEESHNIEHKKEKDRLKKEYIRRLRSILSTELSAKKNASNWIIGNTSTKIQLWNY